MSSIYLVDAFTSEPFTGNPAAVCILSEPAQEPWMQKVAQEMNFSETAFLYKQGDAFDLRWFTPAVEIDLCGHATLQRSCIMGRGLFETRSEGLFSYTQIVADSHMQRRLDRT
jgi:PhzF family phenazine biosynthesis protein